MSEETEAHTADYPEQLCKHWTWGLQFKPGLMAPRAILFLLCPLGWGFGCWHLPHAQSQVQNRAVLHPVWESAESEPPFTASHPQLCLTEHVELHLIYSFGDTGKVCVVKWGWMGFFFGKFPRKWKFWKMLTTFCSLGSLLNQFNFLAPLGAGVLLPLFKPVSLCAFFNTEKHLKRCLTVLVKTPTVRPEENFLKRKGNKPPTPKPEPPSSCRYFKDCNLH